MRRKIISALVSMFCFITLLPTVGVSAKEIMYTDKYEIKGVEGEYIVADIDFTIKSGQTTSFGIRTFDSGDPAGLPFGAVRFTKNGDVLIAPNAKSWDQDWWAGSDFIETYRKATFKHDTQYNLKMRLDYENQLVEYFLDNKFIGKNTTGKCYGYWWQIAFVGEEADTDLFVRRVNSVKAVNRGEMSMEFKEAADEKIIVEFSEPPADEVNFLNTKLINTNELASGGADAYIVGYERVGSNIELTYANELKAGCEYAVILPENIEGMLGGKLDENYVYFTTDSTVTAEGKNYTFDSYNASTDLRFNPDSRFDQSTDDADTVKNTLALGKGKSGNGLLIDYAGEYDSKSRPNGNFTIIDNPVQYFISNHGTPSPSSVDIQVFSMDVKPLHSNLMAAFRFYSTSGNPIVTGFAKEEKILGGRNWDSYEICKANDGWWNDRITLNNKTWSKDEWINIRLEWDNAQKKGKLYINNEAATPKNNQYSVETAAGDHSGIENIRLCVYQNEMEIPEENKPEGLMMLDNVVTYGITKNVTVSKVRFTERDGDVKGPNDILDRTIEDVKVYFNNDIDSGTITEESLKLTYDGTEIGYEAEYLAGEKCVVLKPDSLPGMNDNVSVEVTGVVAENTKTVSDYKCSAAADDTEDDVTAEGTMFVNSDGTEAKELSGGDLYVETAVINTTASEQKVVVSAMGYKDGALEKYSYEYLTLPAGSVFEINEETIPSVSINPEGLDSVRAAVQVLSGGRPVTSGAYIEKTASSTGEYKITGIATGAEAKANVLIEVYAKDKTHTSLDGVDVTDFRDVLLYKTQVKSDENKKFNANFNVIYSDAESGIYDVYKTANNYYEKAEMLYVNPAEASSVLTNDLKPAIASGDDEAVGEVLLTEKYNLYIDDKYISEAVADEAGAILIEYCKDNTLTEANAKVVINKAVAIAAFNQGKISDIIADAEIFNLEGSSISDVYDADYVSAENISNLTKRMGNEKYTSIDEFDKKIENEFVFEIVENPSRPGVVKEVCEGIGLGGYSSKAYTSVSGNSFASIKDLENALDKANSSGTGGGNGGGTGGGSSTVYMPGGVTAVQPAEKDAAPFNDLDGYKWAEEAILTLFDKEIVNGTSENTFEPERVVRREEFVKMLCIAFGYGKAAGRTGFDDVVPNEWYEPYVKKAADTDIVTGISENLFGVGDNITRQDMAVIIYRALGDKLSNPEATYDFADAENIADYAKDAVNILSGNGIVNGVGDNNFAPEANATRAEAAVIIMRCMEKFSL